MCSVLIFNRIMDTASNKIGPETRLKRFLYTSIEGPKFLSGCPEYHKGYEAEKVTSVKEILHSDNPKLLFNIVEIINSEGLVPRRESLFYVLALATISTTDSELIHQIYITLQNITKSTDDLFVFLKFYTKFKKRFGTAINKIIGSFYNKKDPLLLAKEIIRTKSFHSWTHKDVIKLSHQKCNCPLTRVVITYILHGIEKAKMVAEGNPNTTDIITLLSNAHELKRCEDEERVSELIPMLHCSFSQVPSYFHHSRMIWEALIPEMTLQELIVRLPKLYKLGFLKLNSTIQNKVLEILNDAEIVKNSKINPIEVFIGLRNFEKGGKSTDPKLISYLETQDPEKIPKKESIKCPPVVSALNKAMQFAFRNTKSTGRRIMIGIEISKKMEHTCMNNRNISCLEAATIITLSLLKSERDVTVAVFNDTKISIVQLEKGITFNQAHTKLKATNHGTVILSSLFDWATNKKKQIDVFINFFHYHWYLSIPKERRNKEKPLNQLANYRKKMSLPHTKLISFSLDSPSLELADGSSNILDVCGFSKEVPNIIEAFSRGLFY